jgi:RNA-directed DNA polymerase
MSSFHSDGNDKMNDQEQGPSEMTVQLQLEFPAERLFDHLLSMETLRSSFKKVRANKGSPGIDGVTVDAFGANIDEELARLLDELRSWRYKPKPVRRVDIPKPGSKETRKLGVPCVRDRVVQNAIRMLLEPILEPMFSGYSYGFRPGRSQRDAVHRAKKAAEEWKEFTVDIDLEKFFDTVQHDRLLSQLSKVIDDKRIVRLIGMTLRSGIMFQGLVSPSLEGTTQGSPLSPLLSNFVLDELDKELERRGLDFARYADDCNVFVKTKALAERVMASLSIFIEKKLKLKVNKAKSKVAPSREVKFLGLTIVAGNIVISKASMKRARAKIAELSPRRTHNSLATTIKEFNSWYRGWSNYYSMTQFPSQLNSLEAHFRRRLRCRIIAAMVKRSMRPLIKGLAKRGIKPSATKKQLCQHKGLWALSHCSPVDRAYPNAWFAAQGLFSALDDAHKHPHWKTG